MGTVCQKLKYNYLFL